MKEIRCKEIELMYLGDKVIAIEEFIINTLSSKIIIKTNKINKAFSFSNYIEKKQYIYGIDKDNNPFTLYDCYVYMKNNSIDEIVIVWNKMLHGIKEEKSNELIIDKLEVIFDNDNSYRGLIGKKTYYIENHSIKVTVDLNVEEDEIKEIDNGIRLTLKSNNRIDFNTYLSSFKMLIEVYYFMIGFFPDYYIYKMYINNKVIYYYNPNKDICNSKEIYARKVNCIVDTNNVDYENVYKEWKDVYSVKKSLFHLFIGTQQKYNYQFEEINTFNYIQCLESFYTTFFSEYYKFPDKYKKKIINKIKFAFSKKSKLAREIKKDIRRINKESDSNYSYDELFSSIDGKFNSINEISLNQLIGKLLNLPIAMNIFKYEIDNNLISLIRRKIYAHRNYIAHIKEDNRNIFKGKENILIQNKLKMLFRCIVLEKIGIEVDINYLNLLISDVDKYYDDYTIES